MISKNSSPDWRVFFLVSVQIGVINGPQTYHVTLPQADAYEFPHRNGVVSNLGLNSSLNPLKPHQKRYHCLKGWNCRIIAPAATALNWEEPISGILISLYSSWTGKFILLCFQILFICLFFFCWLMARLFLGLNLDGEVGKESKEVCKEESSICASTEEEE